MKVILCEDVDNLGSMGMTVKVASGFARNYLLPRKMAVASDSASARQIEHEMRIIRKKEERLRTELTEVSKDIAKLQVEMLAKAGESGKLFGSITTLHIAQKLQDLGHEINRRKILLDEPIRSLGDHNVTINLGAGVEATIKVSVVADEEPVEETEATKETVAPEAGEANAGETVEEVPAEEVSAEATTGGPEAEAAPESEEVTEG